MSAGELHDVSGSSAIVDWSFTPTDESAAEARAAQAPGLPAAHSVAEMRVHAFGLRHATRPHTAVLASTSAPRSRTRRTLAVVFLLFAALLLSYLFYLAKQIERQSSIDDARPADVIVVLGAAEYRGNPSPVLQSRLNHALMLYLKGLAPYMLTTGGAGGDPDFTEGEVGRAYLAQHGVPSESIITEAEGSTTGQSLDNAAEAMHRMNLRSCIVVSDGYHIYRVKRILQARGIQVYGSPRPASHALSVAELRWLYFKQAVGFALWQAGINI